ncbi:hypothetical protein [Aurantivibrio plasticivorans]
MSRLLTFLAVVTFMSTGSDLFAQGLSDPTLPLEKRGKASGGVSLQLNSILIADDRKVAVINGHVISVGESVAGIRVVSVEEQAVHVLHQGRKLRLSMGGSAVGVRK